jgi:hypothetical protein
MLDFDVHTPHYIKQLQALSKGTENCLSTSKQWRIQNKILGGARLKLSYKIGKKNYLERK